MIEKCVFQSIREKHAAQASPAKFVISCSHTRTILQTARKKMTANAPASILYRKNYKMPRPNLPPYSCLCPRTAQERNPVILRSTRYSCDYKPLLTVEPAEPAAQGIILIKTANAVITFFSSPYTMEKKIGFFGKIGTFESNTRFWQENGEWHATAYNERFCEMAAVTPQTILCVIERLSPAGTLVEAATSQSRKNDVSQSLRACDTSRGRLCL